MAEQPHPVPNNRERLHIGATLVLLVILVAFGSGSVAATTD
jgi:hypothetical protein